MIILLTGLSGSGKSTLANSVCEKLRTNGFRADLLDGDICRKELCRDLSFTRKDRIENIRRIGVVANILSKNEIITLIAAINPYEEMRNELKTKYKNVHVVWVRCGIEELKRRDTKNLYYKATLPPDHPEKINNLSGINDPFDTPCNPDLIIDTTKSTIENSVLMLLKYIEKLLNK